MSSFADLFAAEGSSAPAYRAIRVGQSIEAVVVALGKDSVFCEIDGKRQAYFESAELKGEDGEYTVKVGDTVRAAVLGVEPNGGIARLGRTMGKGSMDLSQLQVAKEAKLPIDGKVVAINKGGLEIELGKGLRGFCPMSQISNSFIENANDMLGTSISVLVTEIKDGGKKIVVSRKAVAAVEAEANRERVLSGLQEGTVVKGVISAVRDFGAFVDLGGLEGMIPVSEMGHDRGVAAADRVTAGETVEAQVLSIKTDEKGKLRVTLSLRALLPMPEGMERPAAGARGNTGPKISIGDVVECEVVRIETYGLFAQVAGSEGRGGRGLIPVSEIGVPRGTDLQKAFPLTTKLQVRVMETGDGKLKLSVRGAKDAEERKDFDAHKKAAHEQRSMGTFGDLLKLAQNKKK